MPPPHRSLDATSPAVLSLDFFFYVVTVLLLLLPVLLLLPFFRRAGDGDMFDDARSLACLLAS